MKKFTLITLLFLGAYAHGQNQSLSVPRASQKAYVEQVIGLTTLSVDYSSPAVKNRDIWGGLVPYGEIWRAGANENTVFYTEHDIQVEGKLLPAGKYGLHMIPSEEGEWTVIFSNDHKAWGSYAYVSVNDEIRVSVTPQVSEHREWLSYDFKKRESDGCQLVLHWEKLQVPISISVPVHEIVFENMKDELTGINRFGWAAWNQAALYALQNNLDLDEALALVDQSLKWNSNFTNQTTKALILKKMGKDSEADKIFQTLIPNANENELNNLGYTLMNLGYLDHALEVFEENAKKHPQSWNVYDSLAEAQLAKGKNKEAKKNYTKALSMAPEAQKPRLKNILKGL